MRIPMIQIAVTEKQRKKIAKKLKEEKMESFAKGAAVGVGVTAAAASLLTVAGSKPCEGSASCECVEASDETSEKSCKKAK